MLIRFEMAHKKQARVSLFHTTRLQTASSRAFPSFGDDSTASLPSTDPSTYTRLVWPTSPTIYANTQTLALLALFPFRRLAVLPGVELENSLSIQWFVWLHIFIDSSWLSEQFNQDANIRDKRSREASVTCKNWSACSKKEMLIWRWNGITFFFMEDVNYVAFTISYRCFSGSRKVWCAYMHHQLLVYYSAIIR
jgi:hypothetical protein